MRKTYNLLQETKPFTSPRTNYRKIINLLSDCNSILDVGCGTGSPLRCTSRKYLVGLDACKEDLDTAKRLQTHDEYFLADAIDLNKFFKPQQFDACVALDVIEHLTKESGIQFIRDLENIAKKKVIIFTPNGFLPQTKCHPGDFQDHLSGWVSEEFRKLGYNVIGLDGLKILRAEHHELRFRPTPFWAIISWITQQFWCEKHPNSAAALLSWKSL